MFGLKLPKTQHLKRYHIVFGILAQYGFGDVFANSRAKKLIPKNYLKKHPDTEKLLSLSTFARVRMVMEQLGPSFVKMGQLLSNREDLLPPELNKELEKLQDHAEALKNFEVERVVGEVLEIDCSEYFRSIAPQPLAAASLAQVHMMTHLFENGAGNRIIAAKGAPEAFLEISSLTDAEKSQIRETID